MLHIAVSLFMKLTHPHVTVIINFILIIRNDNLENVSQNVEDNSLVQQFIYSGNIYGVPTMPWTQ